MAAKELLWICVNNMSTALFARYRNIEIPVCSKIPLHFSSQSINLIKDVASPYKLYSLSEGAQGNWGISILNRIEIVA